MFTGIVSSVGLVTEVARRHDLMAFGVEAPAIASTLAIGDSVAVNGVCLTATETSDAHFRVEVMAETLARTTLGRLAQGRRVNLELPLCLTDRLGGHLVQGHVDGVGTVTRSRVEEESIRLTVRVGSDLMRYVVPKGSVAVEGVALTVADVTDDTFEVALIPHTLASTTLGDAAIEDEVNVEVDVVAKYIERLLPGHQTGTITAGGKPAPS